MGTIMELQDVWKIYLMGEFDVPALQGINMRIEASESGVVPARDGSKDEPGGCIAV